MTETFINKSTLQENYSTLPNKLINDEKLSGDGLAVLVYLLSKPADWKVNAQNIANRFGYGINKVYSIIKQLIQYGYVKKDVMRDQGKYTQIVYHVYDQPFHCLPQMDLPQMDISETYKVKKEQNKESTNEREPTIWDIAVPRLIQSGIDEKKSRGVIMMLLKSLKLVKDVTEKEKIVLDAIFKMPDTVTQYDRVLPYLTAIVKKADKVIEPVKVYGSVIKQLTADDVLTAGPAMQDYYRRKKEMEVINLVNSGAVNKEQIGWFYGS